MIGYGNKAMVNGAAATSPNSTRYDRHIYLTEDESDGRFYRWLPGSNDWPQGAERPALDEGRLPNHERKIRPPDQRTIAEHPDIVGHAAPFLSLLPFTPVAASSSKASRKGMSGTPGMCLRFLVAGAGATGAAIEYSIAGGRCNTDSIDNSGGVNRGLVDGPFRPLGTSERQYLLNHVAEALSFPAYCLAITSCLVRRTRYTVGKVVPGEPHHRQRQANLVVLVALVLQGHEIARQDRPSLYDRFADRPEPLVPRHLRFGVAGLLLLPLFARHRLGTLRPLPALFLACGAGAPYVLHLDFAADMARMAADPETQRWWKLTEPCQEPVVAPLEYSVARASKKLACSTPDSSDCSQGRGFSVTP